MEDIESTIKNVFAEKPVGKYHETERLWEILYRLDLVSDNELPDFLNDISLPESSSSAETSATEEKKEEAPPNPFASFIEGFQRVIGEISSFTETDEGKNLMSSLPGGIGTNITAAVGEFSSKEGENNFSRLLDGFRK